jgi:arginyl-tRNA synthetase
MLRQAEELNISFDKDVDFSLIKAEKEIDLLKKVGEFPQVVGEAALKRIPHRISNYIFDLASTLHSFYNAEKVLDKENIETTKARLALIQTVRITLKNALALIGVSAPEKM